MIENSNKNTVAQAWVEKACHQNKFPVQLTLNKFEKQDVTIFSSILESRTKITLLRKDILIFQSLY